MVGLKVANGITAAAGALGAGSLVVFLLFLWTGSFGLIDMQLGESSVLAWDAALCLIFFAQHSGMVRKSFRRRLRRVLPEPCHGLVYTVASAIALLLLAGGWQRSVAGIYGTAGAARWLVGTVLLLAIGGFLWGVRSLGGFDAFGAEAFLSYARGEQSHPARLTIAGPYRWVRHPFYACSLVVIWVAPELSLDRLLLDLLFTAWIVVGATLEERDLVAEFGQDYRDYQRAVPMLLPRRAPRRGTGARRGRCTPVSTANPRMP